MAYRSKSNQTFKHECASDNPLNHPDSVLICVHFNTNTDSYKLCQIFGEKMKNSASALTHSGLLMLLSPLNDTYSTCFASTGCFIGWLRCLQRSWLRNFVGKLTDCHTWTSMVFHKVVFLILSVWLFVTARRQILYENRQIKANSRLLKHEWETLPMCSDAMTSNQRQPILLP